MRHIMVYSKWDSKGTLKKKSSEVLVINLLFYVLSIHLCNYPSQNVIHILEINKENNGEFILYFLSWLLLALLQFATFSDAKTTWN